LVDKQKLRWLAVSGNAVPGEENPLKRCPKVATCAQAALLAVLVTFGLVPVAQAHMGGGLHDHAAAESGLPPSIAPIAGLSSQSPLQRLSTAQAAAEPAHVLIFTETTQFRHTDAINQGTPKLRAAFEAAGITSEHTEDSAIFNDTDLARFDALVMFQTSGDPWTAAEKAAMERYQRAGNGIVAIHNATDMRGNYTWWDNLIGALMPGHANTGTSPGPQASVIAEDQVHPSTKHLPDRWVRGDEWYNFSRNVRGDAHVLLTLDETSYDPGGNRMGYDHPISWCKPYDGGRAWGDRHGPLRRALRRAGPARAHRGRRAVGGGRRRRRLRRYAP
jgi:hypothetical protein